MVGVTYFLIFALCAPSFALNYYIDASCDPAIYPNVQPALEEALSMAQAADGQLGNSRNLAIRPAFRAAFSASTLQLRPVSEVRRILGGIKDMTQTYNLFSSDVRFYCDQDVRWTLQPDQVLPNPPPEYTPNSLRVAENQTWVDLTNAIFTTGTPGCKRRRTIGQTYYISANIPAQRAGRATISLCRPYIAANGLTKYFTLSQVNLLPRTKLDDLGTLLSVTVLHELTHIPRFDTEDIKPAYRWENVVRKGTKDALGNAENYAYFGLLALLGNSGITLDPGRPARLGILTGIPDPAAGIGGAITSALGGGGP